MPDLALLSRKAVRRLGALPDGEVPMLALDPAGRVRRWNSAMEQLSGSKEARGFQLSARVG